MVLPPQTPSLTSPLRYSGFPSIVRMFWILLEKIQELKQEVLG